MKQMQRRSTLTMPQFVKVSDRLREVCHTDEEGFAVFEEGWDDERVALTFSEFPVAPQNVKTVRIQLIGGLKSKGNPKPEGKQVVTKDDIKPLVTKLSDIDYFIRALCDHLDVDPIQVMTSFENRKKKQVNGNHLDA